MSGKMKRHQSYVGVYYRDSTTRKQGDGRPDRCFYVTHRDQSGKKVWINIGWACNGITAEDAHQKRAKILAALRAKDRVAAPTEATLTDVWEKYLDVNSKLRSIEFYKTYFKIINSAIGDKKLKDITEYDFAVLVKKMADKSPIYSKNVLRFAGFLIKCAIRWRMFDGSNPAENIKAPRYDWNRTRMLTVDEAGRLLEHLKGENILLHDIVYLAMFTGMRLNEVLNLDTKDIDFSERRAILLNTKTGATGYVFISDNVMNVIKRNVSGLGDMPIFRRNGKRVKDTWVQSRFKRAVDELGLNEGVSDSRQRVVFHTLRHTFASWMSINGESVAVVQKLMRHANINMTMRYTHFSDEIMRSALDKIQSRVQLNS